MGTNLGAFLAPLIAGTLGEQLGWHYGFTIAGVGMTAALVIYVFALRILPPDELAVARAKGIEHRPLDRDEWRSVLALLALIVPTTFFWATYEQMGNTIALWADDYTDRHIDLVVWRGEIPTTLFQAFNPFMIFTFTPFIVALWAWQNRRGREPSTVVKMALGCFGVTLANLLMVGAAWQAGGAPDASWLWLLGYFVIITIGELYLSPIGLSLVTKVSPARIVSMMMGIWLASSFTGNFIAGWLGSFWSTMDKMMFFLMIAGIAMVAGAVILAFDRPLRSALKE
jgi:POT family proton-dependent oligopeptide transporter